MQMILKAILLMVVLILVPIIALSGNTGFLSKAGGGGSVVVIKDIEKFEKEFDLSSENQICNAIDGTMIKMLERKDYLKAKDYWTKIEILDGDCKDKIGWVFSGDIRLAKTNK